MATFARAPVNSDVMHQSRKYMPIALAIFAVLIVVASAIAIIFPSELLNYVLGLMAGSGIWWAASTRVLLAVLLWFSAVASRTPITFRVLAILALASAVFIVVIGSEGLIHIIDWFSSWPLWGVRIPSVLGVVFGLFLLWSISSKRSDA